MTAELPVSLIYNLNRLGQAGDEIVFSASDEERSRLARFAEVQDVAKFAAKMILRKPGPNRFAIQYELAAEIVQACVVTLEPLVARISQDFARELRFSPPLRRGAAAPDGEIIVPALDDDAPEPIENLQYDLAGPLVEEFVLSIDPYPRAPGVEFAGQSDDLESNGNPFAVLKGLKSSD